MNIIDQLKKALKGATSQEKAEIKAMLGMGGDTGGDVEIVDHDARIKALEAAQTFIKHGSKEHEALLGVGYNMTKNEAEFIIADVDKQEGDSKFPYAEYKKAKAMLEALGAKPVVMSTRQPWRTRTRNKQTTVYAHESHVTKG